ncbi:hypothetical protein ABH920_003363 [Catenulispora sp. EB89]|uniref:hypothetical protein n=1 Tax=Catenulispora sp. EB89 TaxID=3156257 RepID=UPI00351394AB
MVPRGGGGGSAAATMLWSAVRRLPDLRLAVRQRDLVWKADHRQHALSALPVTFAVQR